MHQNIKLEINKVRSHKHSNEDELKLLAKSNNYVYLGKTEKTGIYEIQCQMGHTMNRYKRDFDKKCMVCNS